MFPFIIIFVWNGDQSFLFSVIDLTVWEKFQAILDALDFKVSIENQFLLLELEDQSTDDAPFKFLTFFVFNYFNYL